MEKGWSSEWVSTSMFEVRRTKNCCVAEKEGPWADDEERKVKKFESLKSSILSQCHGLLRPLIYE